MVEALWDPDTHPLPPWGHLAVATLLTGLEPMPAETIILRHARTDVIWDFRGVDFSCGCSANDYLGWQPCASDLHRLLAKSRPTSPTVERYRSLRTIFDAVLAEAWRRRAREPEAYYEFYEARGRKPFLKFETWQQTHDLCGRSVWQHGFLQAYVEHTPLDEKVTLYKAGRDALALDLVGDDEHEALPTVLSAAIARIFGA
jgi:hypothetical protein